MTERLVENEGSDVEAAAMVPSILLVVLSGRQSERLRAIKSRARGHLVFSIPDPQLKRVIENVKK
jgi:hypothetical protein